MKLYCGVLGQMSDQQRTWEHLSVGVLGGWSRTGISMDAPADPAFVQFGQAR